MTVEILTGDCRDVLRSMEAESVQTCITSPPYFALRSYLPDDHPAKANEIGQEATPEEFIATLVGVFREVRRVLRDDGTLWVNIGDSSASSGGKGDIITGKHADRVGRRAILIDLDERAAAMTEARLAGNQRALLLTE